MDQKTLRCRRALLGVARVYVVATITLTVANLATALEPGATRGTAAPVPVQAPTRLGNEHWQWTGARDPDLPVGLLATAHFAGHGRGTVTPLPSSPGRSEQDSGLGSPAVPVWLTTPCSS